MDHHSPAAALTKRCATSKPKPVVNSTQTSQGSLITFEAIGTPWSVLLPKDRWSTDITKCVVELCYQFDIAYSRFISNSYIGYLNRNKLLHAPPAELLKMLKFYQPLAELSNRAFTPAVGGDLEAKGYDTTYSFQTSNKTVEHEYSFSDNHIRLSPHTSLDLGGIGKGWLIDKVASCLEVAGFRSYIIDAGGDIRVCHCAGWQIALEHPRNARQAIGSITITYGAVACSAPNRRQWIDQHGSRQHHLIGGSDEVDAVFTWAPTATQADAASTALFVSHPNRHDAIARHLEAEYLIVGGSRAYSSTGYLATLFTN